MGCAGKSRKMWVTRDSCVKLQDNGPGQECRICGFRGQITTQSHRIRLKWALHNTLINGRGDWEARGRYSLSDFAVSSTLKGLQNHRAERQEAQASGVQKHCSFCPHQADIAKQTPHTGWEKQRPTIPEQTLACTKKRNSTLILGSSNVTSWGRDQSPELQCYQVSDFQQKSPDI